MVRSEIHGPSGTEILCNRGLRFHYSPRPQVLNHSSNVQPLSKAALDTNIGRGQVIFKMHRRELLIIGSPASHQSSLAPWRPDAELNRTGKCLRVLIAFGERT